MAAFVQKWVNIFWKKVCYTFICAKTVSGRLVRHLLAYFNVHKWLMGTFSSTWNFGPKWPTPFKNGDFQSIFARSTSAGTPSEEKFNYH